ncbi:hypothetical protein OF865_03350 [Escherichia coli]|nr:hypothetical protein OF865_03350 [Escherichia coli]
MLANTCMWTYRGDECGYTVRRSRMNSTTPPPISEG